MPKPALAPLLRQQQTHHNMHFTVHHPQRKREPDSDSKRWYGISALPEHWNPSEKVHVCFIGEEGAKQRGCCVYVTCGVALGYSVNTQRHNAPLLRPAMVWVSATITSAVGGWVGERLENVEQKHNEKILAVKILSDKSRQKHEQTGRTQRGVLRWTDPGNIWTPDIWWWMWRNFVFMPQKI